MILRDLLRASLRCIQQLTPGRGPSPSEITDALFVANQMLESWSVERLAVYRIAQLSYNVTAGNGTYTIGPGGDFDRDPRPNQIDRAFLVNGAERTELGVLTDRQYGDRRHSGLYFDRAFPLANIYFDAPEASQQLELHEWERLLGLGTDPDAEVSFPDGYSEAIKYQLAVRLAPEWGRELRGDVKVLADESLARIKALNMPVLDADIEASLLSYPRYTWDIYTNRYR